MQTLKFPPTDVLAMVDFKLATAIGAALVRKGILTNAELAALYKDVANSLSDTPEMEQAKTLLRELAS